MQATSQTWCLWQGFSLPTQLQENLGTTLPMRTLVIPLWLHPGGGCRMGTDPARSVVDSHGRTHDHENLFVVGSPTMPTGGCTNGTLTFVALALRSAEAIARL